MAKTINVKIIIKHHSKKKLIITFKKDKSKRFLENWYKRLKEFVAEETPITNA